LFSEIAFSQSSEILSGVRIATGVSTFASDNSTNPFSFSTSYELGLSFSKYRAKSVKYSLDFFYAKKGGDQSDGKIMFDFRYLVMAIGPNIFLPKTKTAFCLEPYFAMMLHRDITSTDYSKLPLS
jgi:hypothetical protein